MNMIDEATGLHRGSLLLSMFLAALLINDRFISYSTCMQLKCVSYYLGL
uniref:Uncharacterized protein n=1 Tax=Arundo donax TaxID=35708 RepID=A0A0A9GT87_ARUDO